MTKLKKLHARSLESEFDLLLTVSLLNLLFYFFLEFDESKKAQLVVKVIPVNLHILLHARAGA